MLPIELFWRAADRWPDNVAIDAPGGSLRYRELAGQVAALATHFMTLDPAPQSRVGICAGNSAEHIVALLAVLASGKIWVPLNPKSTQPELRRIIDATTPSIVVLDAACEALLGDAPGTRLYTGHASDSADVLSAVVLRYPDATRPALDLNRDATQAIKFTGGTTGAPKGVMQPYRAWMTNIVNQIHAWGFTEADRYVMAAPITHGTSTYVMPILAQGGCHVIMEGSGA